MLVFDAVWRNVLTTFFGGGKDKRVRKYLSREREKKRCFKWRRKEAVAIT